MREKTVTTEHATYAQTVQVGASTWKSKADRAALAHRKMGAIRKLPLRLIAVLWIEGAESKFAQEGAPARL
jgi:hypothetical protein